MPPFEVPLFFENFQRTAPALDLLKAPARASGVEFLNGTLDVSYLAVSVPCNQN